MNRDLALELLTLVPTEATEVIIKGRDTKEVFFTMPRDWKPEAEELKTRVVAAPPALLYHGNDKTRPVGRRWRIK